MAEALRIAHEMSAAEEKLAEGKLAEETLAGGRVRLVQPPRGQGFRAAIDPLFLAALVPAGHGQRALEIGAGTGAAALSLALRVPGLAVDGLELQPDLAALAQENARRNQLEGRVRFLAGDLLAPPDAVTARPYDHVFANPPYLKAGAADAPADAARALALVEGAADLGAWVAFAGRVLKPRGSLTLVHRADRLDDLLAAFRGRFGAVLVCPLWPKAGRDAKRVLVRAQAGARGPLRMTAGVVLHEDDGRYTQAALDILWDLQPLLP